jgi:hypothetical protein
VRENHDPDRAFRNPKVARHYRRTGYDLNFFVALRWISGMHQPPATAR